MNERY